MSVSLVATSHSPLMGIHEPAEGVAEAVESEFESVRAFVRSFDPELVVVFGPDHYNGVFYDMLPPFCIGAQATSVGDWGTTKGPLNVSHDDALAIAEHALSRELDLALSERMHIDHGFAQPLEIIFGAIDAVPTVPIFINSVAEPLGPAKRARLLGAAVGEAIQKLDKRVLLLGSGGLSHDPPVPTLANASPDITERLIAGRDPAPELRASREAGQIETARKFAAGEASLLPLNPRWDLDFLDVLATGQLEKIDSWTNDWFVEQAGHSSHEVRTWIAAYAALAACGPYEVLTSFYREIPEWIAGFGITTAAPSKR
jgi:2,3-dihydroxyphenylpropionate 1,2-dioxygenase